jgi:hypothetical protein
MVAELKRNTSILPRIPDRAAGRCRKSEQDQCCGVPVVKPARSMVVGLQQNTSILPRMPDRAAGPMQKKRTGIRVVVGGCRGVHHHHVTH